MTTRGRAAVWVLLAVPPLVWPGTRLEAAGDDQIRRLQCDYLISFDQALDDRPAGERKKAVKEAIDDCSAGPTKSYEELADAIEVAVEIFPAGPQGPEFVAPAKVAQAAELLLLAGYLEESQARLEELQETLEATEDDESGVFRALTRTGVWPVQGIGGRSESSSKSEKTKHSAILFRPAPPTSGVRTGRRISRCFLFEKRSSFG